MYERKLTGNQEVITWIPLDTAAPWPQIKPSGRMRRLPEIRTKQPDWNQEQGRAFATPHGGHLEIEASTPLVQRVDVQHSTPQLRGDRHLDIRERKNSPLTTV